MKLGMLTACLPQLTLEEIVPWASQTGFQALEVACWPQVGARAFEAAHLPIDSFGESEAERTRRLFDEHGMSVSALAFYENNLHPDPQRRDQIAQHLCKVVDAAALLEVPYVGTFIGRDWNRSVSDNLREAEAVFPRLVDHAGERGVRLMIENCVMEGWHPDGYPGNLAYSPELWEWMFSLDLYLNWDPSHLVWVGIDPVSTIAPYADRIVHAQAKDIQVMPGQVDRYGFFGRAVDRPDPWDVGWWRYRVPGRGQVPWGAVVDALYEHGFAGTLSVEHEDPVWGGTVEKVQQGLQIAHRTLRPLFVA